jgi:beta-lactamase regulating signal transducer with metallopeptidase domain
VLDLLWKGAPVLCVVTSGLQTAFHQSVFAISAAASTMVTVSVERLVTAGGAHSTTIRSVSSPGWPGHSWYVAAIVVWLAGALLHLLWTALRHQRFVRATRNRTIVGDPTVRRMVDELVLAGGVHHPVAVSACDRLAVPVVLSQREICVPAGLLPALDEGSLKLMLAHEVAHIARRDGQWLRIASVWVSIFWFQPILRLARRRWREAAEFCCDEWAAREAGDRLSMASCLVRVAEWKRLGAATAEPALLEPSQLSRRVAHLLEPASTPRRGRGPAILALALLPLAGFAPTLAPHQRLMPGHEVRVYRVVRQSVAGSDGQSLPGRHHAGDVPPGGLPNRIDETAGSRSGPP